MGGFFNRLYYGKAGKADFTQDDLPSNRFQLFWEVLRVRFWSLFRVNLMQVVFWIPMIVWTYINIVAMQSIDVETLMQAEDGAAQIQATLMGFFQMYLLGLIPCIAITGPSSAAAAYITRNWARDQHSFVWSDLKDAFKENWKQALAVSAITGFVPFIAYIGFTFYGEMAKRMPVLVIAQVLVMLICLIWVLMAPLMYPLMVGYKLRFRDLLRNGLLLAIGRLPQMVGIRLLTAIPVFLLLLGVYTLNIYVLLGVALYYILFGHAFARLIYASVANAFFDKFINPRIDGAQVGRGLRKEDEFDDDEEEEEAAKQLEGRSE